MLSKNAVLGASLSEPDEMSAEETPAEEMEPVINEDPDLLVPVDDDAPPPPPRAPLAQIATVAVGSLAVQGLDEVMDWPAVSEPTHPGYQRIWEDIQATRDTRGVIDGHGAGLWDLDQHFVGVVVEHIGARGLRQRGEQQGGERRQTAHNGSPW